MESKKSNSQSKTSYSQKTQRTFSDALKRQKVKEIEQGLVSVSEVSKSLSVTRAAIYKWIKKYSLTYHKPIRMIVESKSESKKVLHLQQRLAELEQLVGQKQIQLEFLEKLIELASDDLGLDLKKNYGIEPSYGSGKTKKKTTLK